MAIAKKPIAIVKKISKKEDAAAEKFIAAAASQPNGNAAKPAPPAAGLTLVPYTFRIDEGLLNRAKSGAAGRSQNVTAFIVAAVLEAVKKFESEG
jgi:hypothetical protein